VCYLSLPFVTSAEGRGLRFPVLVLSTLRDINILPQLFILHPTLGVHATDKSGRHVT